VQIAALRIQWGRGPETQGGAALRMIGMKSGPYGSKWENIAFIALALIVWRGGYGGNVVLPEMRKRELPLAKYAVNCLYGTFAIAVKRGNGADQRLS
jgi:hypothetical protein